MYDYLCILYEMSFYLLCRVGQLMVTTLSHRDKGDENEIDIYSNSPSRPSSLSSLPETEAGGGGGREKEEKDKEKEKEEGEGVNERRRRDIVLRNMMLDMILSLLSSSHMELNSRSA